jgi:RNA polymerase sigma-70 factor (ECF subfamily)
MMGVVSSAFVETTQDVLLLTAAAKRGDKAALERIVLLHQAAIRGWLRSRVRDASTTDDLAQETFIVALRRLADFDESRPFLPWLRGIALNVLRNYRRARRATPLELDALLEPTSEALLPIETEEAIAALNDCVERLDKDDRELVTRRYRDGMTVAEICKLTGAKHSATTMALHRARGRLRDCVRRKLPGEALA